MFDYEKKPYLQMIFGHLYIYHHKTHLHVWFSVIRVRDSADCCQPSLGLAQLRVARVAKVAVL